MAEQDEAVRRKRKRFLSAEQKYELWCQLVRGDGTQREIAERWGVDRSVVLRVRQVAKHGALSALGSSKPGRSSDPRDERIRALETEVARLADTVKEQAVELVLLRERSRGGW